MFSGCLQDFPRMFSGCSDGPGGIWWSLQMKAWTLMIQRNSMIPNYSMIPAIRWSSTIRWSPAIRWSISCMDFDNRKVYGDTSITDGLVYKSTGKHLINHKLLLGYICWKHLNPITLGYWNLGMVFLSTKLIVLYFDISMKSCRRELCIFYVLHSTLMHQHWIAAVGDDLQV